MFNRMFSDEKWQVEALVYYFHVIIKLKSKDYLNHTYPRDTIMILIISIILVNNL